MKNRQLDFFGRDTELAELDGLWTKRIASLVTCRGRRRIGKSTLIEEFARRSGARFIKLEGLRPKKGMTENDQLAFFAAKLSAQTGCDKTPPSDWYSAFVRLDRELVDRDRKVVLLDEISWMAQFSLTFPEILKNAWDDLFRKRPNLVLVLCGSVSSWIRDEIVENRAYVGRRSLDIVVGELPPAECLKFWGKRADRMDPREIIDVLSVTGGVPRYLEEVKPNLSAIENIKRLCFTPKSVLREDFDDMFNDVITERPDSWPKRGRSTPRRDVTSARGGSASATTTRDSTSSASSRIRASSTTGHSTSRHWTSWRAMIQSWGSRSRTSS